MAPLPSSPVTGLRRAVLLLLLVSVTAFLLVGVALPHRHDPSAPGLYNEEHDLGLMAVSAAHALLADGLPTIALVALVAALTPLVLADPEAAPRRLSPSRAPPSR